MGFTKRNGGSNRSGNVCVSMISEYLWLWDSRRGTVAQTARGTFALVWSVSICDYGIHEEERWLKRLGERLRGSMPWLTVVRQTSSLFGDTKELYIFCRCKFCMCAYDIPSIKVITWYFSVRPYLNFLTCNCFEGSFENLNLSSVTSTKFILNRLTKNVFKPCTFITVTLFRINKNLCLHMFYIYTLKNSTV